MTREEMIRYKGIDMADLIRQLREAPDILRDSIAGMSAVDLEAKPIPGKWSTRAVVEHISLVGLGWTNIFYEAIGKVHDNIRNHNVDWAAEETARAQRSIAEALDVYERNNNKVADFLDLLPPADWTRKFPPVQWLPAEFEIRDQLHWGIIGHLHHHLQFIEEKRAALASVRPPL